MGIDRDGTGAEVRAVRARWAPTRRRRLWAAASMRRCRGRTKRVMKGPRGESREPGKLSIDIRAPTGIYRLIRELYNLRCTRCAFLHGAVRTFDPHNCRQTVLWKAEKQELAGDVFRRRDISLTRRRAKGTRLNARCQCRRSETHKAGVLRTLPFLQQLNKTQNGNRGTHGESQGKER